MNLFSSIKAAFLYHWNLLGFFGALGLAALAPFPAVGVPLVLAAETAYLAFLGTHPRFQQYVAAQKAKQQRAGNGRRRGRAGTHPVVAALQVGSALRSACVAHAWNCGRSRST